MLLCCVGVFAYVATTFNITTYNAFWQQAEHIKSCHFRYENNVLFLSMLCRTN